MRSTPIRILAAGLAAIAANAIPLPTAAGQATGPNACALVDAAELMKITGKKDVLGKGPERSTPDQLPKHMSQCDFLGFNFTLTTNSSSGSFAQTRRDHETRPARWKVQSLSGLGDEAFYMWDPRPGSYRSVGIVFRSGTSMVSLGDQTHADSIEAMKKMLLPMAKHMASRVK